MSMDASAALQCLEARLRVWPDEGDVIDLRGRLLELARLDTGSGPWVLSKAFHRLVDDINRGAFCGTTRGDLGHNKELVEDMTAFIKDPYFSPETMLSAFEEEYEVGINPEDVAEAKPKESQESAELQQPDATTERKCLEERLRGWPDERMVIDLRKRLLEMADLDNGSGPWVLSKAFHRLVDGIDRCAFSGTARGSVMGQTEVVRAMLSFLEQIFSSSEEAHSAFSQEFEVGTDQADRLPGGSRQLGVPSEDFRRGGHLASSDPGAAALNLQVDGTGMAASAQRSSAAADPSGLQVGKLDNVELAVERRGVTAEGTNSIETEVQQVLALLHSAAATCPRNDYPNGGESSTGWVLVAADEPPAGIEPATVEPAGEPGEVFLAAARGGPARPSFDNLPEAEQRKLVRVAETAMEEFYRVRRAGPNAEWLLGYIDRRHKKELGVLRRRHPGLFDRPRMQPQLLREVCESRLGRFHGLIVNAETSEEVPLNMRFLVMLIRGNVLDRCRRICEEVDLALVAEQRCFAYITDLARHLHERRFRAEGLQLGDLIRFCEKLKQGFPERGIDAMLAYGNGKQGRQLVRVWPPRRAAV